MGIVMDWNNLVQFGLSTAIAAIAYFYNSLKGKAEKTQEDLLLYKLHVSENYVSTAELTRAVESLVKSIDTVTATCLRIEGRQLGSATTDRRGA